MSARCFAIAIGTQACACTFFFEPSVHGSDASPPIDRDAAMIRDAMLGVDGDASGCAAHQCNNSTLGLFRFSSSAPLENSCAPSNLSYTSMIVPTVMDGPSGLGEALNMQPEKASTWSVSIDGPWTLDFWVRPGAFDGEIISLYAQRAGPELLNCGPLFSWEDGKLRTLWDGGGSLKLIDTRELQAASWTHISFSYALTGMSANTILRFDGGDEVLTTANQCEALSSELIIGNRSTGGIQGAIDELRLQDITTNTTPCAQL